MIRRLLLALLLSSTTIFSFAADVASPVGVWRTIDDKTGKEKSLVRITEVNGEFRGTIEKLFREPNEDQNPKGKKLHVRGFIGMALLGRTQVWVREE